MSRALLLAAVLAATPAAAVNYCGSTQHEDTCGRGNIYPCCDNGSNCTWWAWEMVCRNWHVGLVNWGNANTWAGHASVDPDYDLVGPTVGAIATSTLGNYGHVAWVIGTNGSTVTVTEQNCCTGCSASVRQITYPASKFNSGFVVQHPRCDCAGSTVQTQACGNCGTQSRSCNGCNFSGWSACAGPDPQGGEQVCDTGGKLGVCGDARTRCTGGNLACTQLVPQGDEVCDGLDNDCNGAVDDGHPPLGAKAPAFAATLLDFSAPASLRRGERATVWAEFRNDGTSTWTRDNLWLTARDGAARLAVVGTWPAWNIAAVPQAPVQPGERGRFAFEILPAEDMNGELEATFQLQQPSGAWVGCPHAEVSAALHVMRTGELVTVDGGAPSTRTEAVGGCAAAPGLLPAALLALAALRRRKGAPLPAFAAALLVASGCGPVEPDEVEPQAYASVEQGLVTCEAHQDTGYRNGQPFTITLIVADGLPVERSTANAYAVMQAAAAAGGVGLRINDGFRTPQEQQFYYHCWVTCSCNMCNNAAAPGYSNHQSGTALDLNTSEGNVYNWLSAYAANYGFQRTVPSERWHWEYFGGGPGGGPCPVCNCAGSTVQTQACGNCGAQSRSCNGCTFSNWSACAGPDPEGGDQVCDTGGKLGVCGDARTRCTGGNLTCTQRVAQSAELCDGLDNDCNGEVDEGHPALGAKAPLFAATLMDFSTPASLARGERATAWAEFRNDGTAAWTRDNLWLTARGSATRLYASGAWPAWNVAAVPQAPVQPGERGRFAFELVAGEDMAGEVNATFQLQQPSGTWVGCPKGELSAAIQVLRSGALAADAGHPSLRAEAVGSCGCGAAPGLFPFALLALAARSRRRRAMAACAALALTGCMGEASDDPAVELQSVSPSAVSSRGGTLLKLKGRAFTPSTQVELNGARAKTTYVSPTELTALTPPLWAGAAQLVAIAGGGSQTALTGGVEVLPMELRFVQAPPDALARNSGAGVKSAAARDFDGDGDVDLLTSGADGICTLLTNDGLGFFSPPELATDAGADAGAAADAGAPLRADAGADAGLDAGTVGSAELPRGKILAAEDLDGDGDVDVLLQTASGAQAFARQGSGFTFVAGVPVLAPPPAADAGSSATAARPPPLAFTAVALADVDGDGKSDLITAGATPAQGAFRVELNASRADGLAFAPSPQAPKEAVSYAVTALAVADFDGDHKLDVALATTGAEGFAVRLFLRRGAGYQESPGGLLGPGAGPFAVLLAGDVDGDGAVDLFAIGDGQDRLLLNDGSGHFFDATALSLPLDGSRGTSAVLVDLDRDKDLDLVVGNLGTSSRVYVNDGHGKFQDRTPALPGGLDAVLGVWSVNVDRDGDQDLVALTPQGLRLELSVEPSP